MNLKVDRRTVESIKNFYTNKYHVPFEILTCGLSYDILTDVLLPRLHDDNTIIMKMYPEIKLEHLTYATEGTGIHIRHHLNPPI